MNFLVELLFVRVGIGWIKILCFEWFGQDIIVNFKLGDVSLMRCVLEMCKCNQMVLRDQVPGLFYIIIRFELNWYLNAIFHAILFCSKKLMNLLCIRSCKVKTLILRRAFDLFKKRYPFVAAIHG